MQGFRLIRHYFSLYAGVGIYIPFAPLFLAANGLDSAQIGYLMAIGPLTSIFAQIVWGNLADRQNRRKEYLIFALGGTALACFLLSAGKGMAGLALVLFLYSVFYTAASPLTDSLVLNVLPDTRQYGQFRRWGSLGFAVTAAGGGFLFSHLSIQYFGVVAGVFYLLALAGATTLPNPRHYGVGRIRGGFPIGRVLAVKGMWPFLAVVLLVMTPYNAYTSFLGWHLEHLGTPRTWIGLSWTIAALSEIPVFGLGRIWLKKWPAHVLMGFSALLFGARWLAYAYIPGYLAIVALQFSQSLSFALFYLAAVEHLSRRVEANLLSSAQGLLQAASFGLSAVLGSSGGGWLLKHSNLSTLYICMAAAAIAGAAGAYFLNNYSAA